MASPQELSDFLSSVEQRAFKQAVYAVRDDDAALDIVQDAMIKLAEKYGDRPAAELPLVFTRILQNRIHDWFRRQKVRNTWVSLFSNMGKKSDENTLYELPMGVARKWWSWSHVKLVCIQRNGIFPYLPGKTDLWSGLSPL